MTTALNDFIWFVIAILCIQHPFLQKHIKKSTYIISVIIKIILFFTALLTAPKWLLGSITWYQYIVVILIGCTLFLGYEISLNDIFLYSLISLTYNGLSYHISVMFSNAFGPDHNLLSYLSRLICYVAIYTVFFLFFRRSIIGRSSSSPGILPVLIGIIFCFIFLLMENSQQTSSEMFIRCLMMFLAFIFLLVKFNAAELRQENEILTKLLEQQKQQYELSKEYVATINIKYHDIKHLLNKITTNNELAAEQLQEIETAVRRYDTSVQTGNEALNIVLTEKNMMCEKNNIQLTCMANGKLLNFMRNSDIYSLFGNILDNAIEAVMRLSDPQKKVISFTIREDLGVIHIQAENYFDGVIKSENNSFLTRKSDTTLHGFGIKSIDMIVRQYGGTVNFSYDENLFSVNIIFSQN